MLITMKKFVWIICLFLLSSSLFSQPTLNWLKRIGGTNVDQGNSIAVDEFGNVYTTGLYSILADFDPSSGTFNLTSAGYWDIFVSKYDPYGNLIWAKSFGGTSAEYGTSIAIDSYKNVYITGNFLGTVDFDPSGNVFNLTSKGDVDIFVCKLDSLGNLVWAKNMGGLGGDYANSIALDDNKNIYVSGGFSAVADFDPNGGVFNLTSQGGADIFFTKLDSTGSILWAKSIGSIGEDSGNSITVSEFGNVFLTGAFEGSIDFDPSSGVFNLLSQGLKDVFVSKFDNSGNLLWAKSMGGIGEDIANSISVDDNENVYTTGWFHEVADFDPNSGILNLTSNGEKDIFISKLDSLGNLIWGMGMGGEFNDSGHSITLDSLANVYVVGDQYSAEVDFDLTLDSFPLINIGTEANFIAKYDSHSNFICAMAITPGHNETSYNRHVAVDDNNTVWLLANYSASNVDFDPCTSSNSLIHQGVSDIYLANYDFSNCNCSLKAIITSTPNLCLGECNATATANPKGGIPPYSYSWADGQNTPTITGLCSGTYAVTITDATGAIAIDTIVISPVPVIISNPDEYICLGSSFTLPSGTVVTVAGLYSDTLIGASINGCDSVVNTNLTVNPVQTTTQFFSECQGFSINVGTNTYNTSGVFTDTVSNINGCVVITTNLTIHPVSFFTQNPFICEGQSYLLPSGNFVGTSGTFMDTIPNAAINGCDSIIITNLTVNPLQIFSQNINECEGFSITVGSNTYTSSGLFIDTLSSLSGCDSIITTNLTVNPFPVLSVSEDASINVCDSIQLTVSGASSYLWVPDDYLNCSTCPNPIASPTSSTSYIVTGIIGNCSTKDTVEIRVEGDINILVPNIFTPNNDGLNDGFSFYGDCFKSINKKIYNRWGMIVFESNLINEIWDGRTTTGEEAPEGTYYFIFEAMLDDTNALESKKIFKGTITLLR
jgi:gliding motility-associated-like protein